MITWLRKLVAFPVVIYQKTLSPDHGPLQHLFPHGYCRFNPICSEYMRQAILKKGVIKGSAMGIWRICRCNPWSDGGIDEVK